MQSTFNELIDKLREDGLLSYTTNDKAELGVLINLYDLTRSLEYQVSLDNLNGFLCCDRRFRYIGEFKPKT